MQHAEVLYGPKPSPIHNHYRWMPKCLLPECFNIFLKKCSWNQHIHHARWRSSYWIHTPVYLCWWVLLSFVWVSLTSMLTGFRYISLTNYPGTPDHDTLTAHFVHTGKCQLWIVFHTKYLLQHMNGVEASLSVTLFSLLCNTLLAQQPCPISNPFRQVIIHTVMICTHTTVHRLSSAWTTRLAWRCTIVCWDELSQVGHCLLSIPNILILCALFPFPFSFDMGAAYTSFVLQINDAQDADGAVQDCVP